MNKNRAGNVVHVSRVQEAQIDDAIDEGRDPLDRDFPRQAMFVDRMLPGLVDVNELGALYVFP